MSLQIAHDVTVPLAGFDPHLQSVVLILVICGVLGGIGNFYLRDPETELRPREWLRYPLLGVVAALTVPLVLSMLSSNLVDAGRVRTSDYLVLAGFVLIYVVLSRRLFDSATLRLLGRAEKLQKDLAHVRASLDKAQLRAPQRASEAASAAPAVASADAGEPRAASVEPAAAPAPASPREALTHADVELLRAIGRDEIVVGNLADLVARAGVTRDVAQQRVAVLKGWGALDTRLGDKQVLHWIVTAKGQQLLTDRLR